jgi:hypothetical protein
MSRSAPARRNRAEPARATKRPNHDQPRESDATKGGRQAAEIVAREHDASVNQVKDEPFRSSSHDQRSREAEAQDNVTGPVPGRDADYEEDEDRRG